MALQEYSSRWDPLGVVSGSPWSGHLENSHGIAVKKKRQTSQNLHAKTLL